MCLKIGHGREERYRKESYVVFILKKYSHFAQKVLTFCSSSAELEQHVSTF